jgi:Ca-activated chloride channel family protein
VTLVLAVDVSGSMAGVKLEQAKEALRSALARLRPQDRLQILAFSSRVTSLAEAPIPATRENIDRARAWIAEWVARGGTNIDEALARAIDAAEGEGECTVLLVTDGAPTVGVTDPSEIARLARERNGGDQRIHVLGVGAEVNTRLLDRVARENRGSRTYLEETAELEVALGALLDRVLYPAVTDLRLSVESDPQSAGAGSEAVRVDRLEPPGPWDLFHGDDLVVAGRFRGAGRARLRVEGILGGERRAWDLPADFPRHGGEEEAAFVWAELRIVRLLEELRDRARGAGGDLEREIVDLSLRYGIVTPYTSYLIRESPRGVISRKLGRALEAAPELRVRSDRAADGFVADQGQESLEYSRRAARARREAAVSGGAAGQAAAPGEESLEREVGVLKGGGKALVRLDGDTIVDGELGALDELPAADRTLVHLSDEYFAFLGENPGVERILARGTSILFRWRGELVRVVPAQVGDAAAPVGREYF